MSAFPPFRQLLSRTLAVAVLGAALGACVSVRVPPLPAGDLPVHWRNASSQLGPKPDLTGWWKHFHDPQLDGLVATALKDNQGVAKARWTLRAARALETAATTQFMPHAGFNTLEEPNPENTASYFQAGFDATWELGLFGRSGGSRHVAAANTGAAQAELQSARVSLVAEVVREYLQLCAAQQDATVLAAAAQAAQKKLQLLGIREHLRLSSVLEVEQARASAAKAASHLADPRAAIAQHAQALALLLGLSEPAPAWLVPKPLPRLVNTDVTSLPADLLRTRPEIRYAETRVLKAAGELGIAKANLYPRLALGSSLTYAALVKGQTHLGDINDTFAIGPIINIPLFDWGQRRAVRDARADQLQAALAGYRQAVLQGAAEVETDLAALHAAGERTQHANSEAAAAQRALALTRKLQTLGQADALDVADARLASTRAALDRQQARLAHGLAFVALYKALGGAPLPRPDAHCATLANHARHSSRHAVPTDCAK